MSFEMLTSVGRRLNWCGRQYHVIRYGEYYVALRSQRRLKTNLKAHYFISNQYWKSNYELVKEMMSQYEVYVFEADKMIQGFVGLNDKYIEGIFVSDEMQSCGIGKLLLDYVKDKKVSLRLNVYQKNARAISFYQREGFIIQCEGLDEATGEKEYTMLWKRK